MAGLFITMEGTDGSGKSTQIDLLREYLERKKFDVILVREPGSTEIGEKIREILLNPENQSMGKVTEALLYASSRAQLVHEVIIPNLKKGSIVLCDRYVDSSLVYQGTARGLGTNLVKNINDIATGKLMPDITFFLDIPPTEALSRKKEQKELDRLESEKLHFHNQVYGAYKKLAQENTAIKKIDATKSIKIIHSKVVAEIENLFKTI